MQTLQIIEMPPECPPRTTRASGPLLDPDVVFPEVEKISSQLPDLKTVIGLVKSLLKKGNGWKTEKEVFVEVAKLVYTKWWHDTVYCIAISSVVKRVTKLWGELKEGVKRWRAGRSGSAAVKRYTQIVEERDTLFDIFAHEKERRDQCLLEWGVKMSPAEISYYEDQKGERKQTCDRAVDPVWYTAMMKKQRLKERSEAARKEMQEIMQFKSLEDIEELLQADGSLLEQEHSKDGENNDDDEQYVNVEKRKLVDSEKNDSLPLNYRHVRDSSRKVKEEIYRTLGSLMGKGLSLQESVLACIIVANKLFGRDWRDQATRKEQLSHIETSTLASDTSKLLESAETHRTNMEGADFRDMMPSARSIREAMALLETEALAGTVDTIRDGREEGRMVTHAIDSTTKKRIG